MTGDKLNLTTYDNLGQETAIKNLKDAVDPMIKQAGVYVQKAFNMFEMNTSAAMRMTVIYNHSKELEFNLSREYPKYLEEYGLTNEDMTRNELDIELKGELDSLQQDRDFIRDLMKLIETTERGLNVSRNN